jgi:hypothetical protein
MILKYKKAILSIGGSDQGLFGFRHVWSAHSFKNFIALIVLNI